MFKNSNFGQSVKTSQSYEGPTFFISFVQKSVNFGFFIDTVSYFRFPEVLFPVFDREAVLEKITHYIFTAKVN